MERGFEQENLFTINKHAEEFKKKVKVLIDNREERMALFNALKAYHENGNVSKLAHDIRSIINTPKRYPLYKDVRYIIKPEDVEAFLTMVPNSPSDGIHMVRIHRSGKETLGFSVRGGKEHGLGVYVSLIQRGSAADIVGLKTGDEILSVNNMILTEATHEEVVNLLRSRRSLALKVKSTGKIPCKIHDAVRWEEVEDKENVYYHPDLLEHLVQEGTLTDDKPFQMAPGDKQAFLSVGKRGIGCSVRNGFPGIPGLFVIGVTPGSISDKAGIRVGDEIVSVNGKNITKLSYSEAVYLLKSFQELQLILRHSKTVEKLVRDEESKNDEEKVPEFAIRTQILLKKAEEKEKEKEKEKERLGKMKFGMQEEEEEEGFGQPESQQSSEISPGTTKRALFKEGVQVIGTSSGMISPRDKGAMLPSLQSLNPSNYEKNSNVGKQKISKASPSSLLFESEVLQGREAKFISIDKVSDLGIDIEEENGGIYVKSIKEGGAISDNGNIEVGDQLLNVEGTSLIGISREQAEEELKKAMDRRASVLDLVVAKGSSDDLDDNEVTYTF